MLLPGVIKKRQRIIFNSKEIKNRKEFYTNKSNLIRLYIFLKLKLFIIYSLVSPKFRFLREIEVNLLIFDIFYLHKSIKLNLFICYEYVIIYEVKKWVGARVVKGSGL